MTDSLVTELTPVIAAINAKKLSVANNLSDLNNVATARTNLGLGTASTHATTDYATSAQGTVVNNIYAVNGLVKSNSSGTFTAALQSDITALIGSTTYEAYGTAASLLVGVIRDCGNYNASSNTWPTTGGTGTSGGIVKGDLWFISVAGTLGSVPVSIGASIRALADAPGQTASNWDILPTNYGYVPENITNKTSYTTVSTDYTSSASDTKYPSVKSVYTFVNNEISGLSLGTASTHSATDFDTYGSAANAQTNAETYSSNASNLTTGTVDIGRFPTLNSAYIWIGNVSNVPTALAIAGDASLSNIGILTVTKTNGVNFSASATTDTTDASNISTGTLNISRLPSLIGLTYNGISLISNTVGFSIGGGTTSKSVTISNNITLAGIDGSTLNISTGGTLGTAAFTSAGAYDLSGSAINAQSNAIASAEAYTNNAGNITTGTLTTSVIPILPSGLIPLLSTSQIPALTSASILGTLNINQIPTLTSSQLVGVLNSTQLPAITSGQIIGLLNTTQIPILSTSNLPGITSAQIVGVLSTNQIPALTSNQIVGTLNVNQLPVLTSTQIHGTLNSSQVPVLTSSQITALLGSTTYDVYGAASSAQTAAITASETYSSNASNITSGNLLDVVGGVVHFSSLASLYSATLHAGCIYQVYLPTNPGYNLVCSYDGSDISAEGYFDTLAVMTAMQTANTLPRGLYNVLDIGICGYNSSSITKYYSTGVIIGQNDSVTGNVQKLISSVLVPAFAYTSVYATLGCSSGSDTATLTIYNGLTLLATLTNTGTPLTVSTTGFTLGAATQLSFYLSGSLVTTNSFIYGITLK